MSRWQEKLLFAINVLDGDREAHRILADMLEEEGDLGLAQWARSRKGKRQKRIDFVLALLPHRTSLRIVCDFIVRSLGDIEWHRWPDDALHPGDETPTALIAAISGISDWTQCKADDEALAEYRRAITTVRPWAYGLRSIDTTMLALHAALTYGDEAETLAKFDTRLAIHRAGDSRNAARKVAKASRDLPNASSIDWQIDHVKNVINELLEQNSFDDVI